MAQTLQRREAVSRILALRPDALVVTGLGSPTYDVHAAGDRDGNYYLWGAMGGAALVGLGLAQAQPDRQVVVITGDGEQLMAMGALATIGVAKPGNLELFVLDNEHYAETGMQGSHTGQGVDLALVAGGCGFGSAVQVGDMAGLEGAIGTNEAGPKLVVLKIAQDTPPRSLPSRDAVYIKNRFRAHLGLV
ncbi:aldehyde dehydrogenase [Oceanicola sp. 22II-s10i]|uniref:thiamine pyrophosphate-dependent enzyme n=1 Tax=Oceanicola sp. 22II-s10i TaxID=1317116 RepID=UPI000B5285B5|nr:thiamine pyrophosphate-dependent enzyme [Oceanicola sp. 22II-s10i]OWU83096.1 aldehyde dehydrogenase [Oceanicola sp. 22II-s10i]